MVLPPSASKAQALAFVDSRQEWILAVVERNKKRIKPPQIILPPFSTRLHRLELIPHDINKYNIHISGGVVRVAYPSHLDAASPGVQKIIKQAVAESYRIEARVLLPGRVDELAAKNGFAYKALSFRNTVSRWGSCSADNSISLSINLMLLPDRLVDYVILHELCHTVHKNHGPRFHELLDKVTGGRHCELRKEIRKYTAKQG